MNRRISTASHCFVSVVGPAGSGKTQLIGRMICNQEQMFRPVFDKILYFYKHYQQAYNKLEVERLVKNIDLELIQGMEWNAIERGEILKQRTIFVLDDLYDEAADSKEFLELVIAGRHRNIDLMVLRHNLFQQS